MSIGARPTWLDVRPDQIPERLRERDQWVVWRAKERGGKWTKEPFRISEPSRLASVDVPDSWGRFDDAIEAQSCPELGLDGIGYVLTPADELVGIDLDHCRDSASGVIAAWAMEIVRRIGSYAELSPSGTGVRIFAHGVLPPGRRRKGAVEMYDRGRYLSLTGCRISGALA